MHFFKPHSIIAILLLVSFLGAPLFFLKPPPTHAASFCGVNINIGGSSSGIGGSGNDEVPVKEKEQRSKESLGDCLVSIAAKIAAKILTQSILDWINSGFKGQPTFVQDPKKFLGDVANEVSGAFIAEVGLSALCTPFRPQIQIALYGIQTYYQRSQCTLGDVVDNLQSFYDDFNAGGWTAWISTVQQPQNNPYGAYFISLQEQQLRILEAKQNARDDASQSGGFLSIYECSRMDPFYGDPDFPNYETPYHEGGIKGCESASKTTPGRTIAGQADFALSIGGRQLIEADELNEMIGVIADAFISQLIKQGLSSLNERDNPDLFEDPSIAIKAQLEADLADAIAATEAYLAALTSGRDTLEELILLADDRIACWTAVDAYGATQEPPIEPQYTATIAEIQARKVELLTLLEESPATPEEVAYATDLLDDLQSTDPEKDPPSIRRLLDLGDIITALTEFGKLAGGIPSQEMIDAVAAQSGNYEGELIAANTDLLECQELPGGTPTATSTPPITP
ncbi:MAG: hypothetical protein NUV49_01315 [Patescibacteria group bacterium]|nr:hypothetical protein [Patescibacteria group bacterium]